VRLEHKIGSEPINILDTYAGNPYKWPEGIYIQAVAQDNEDKHYILVHDFGAKVATYFNSKFAFPAACDSTFIYSMFIKLPKGAVFMPQIGVD
jgi:hypothetical protein